MSLSAKIHSSFWSDDDIGNLTPVQKLSVLWVMTNRDTSNLGYVKVAKRQFEFDTGLSIEHLEGACKGLARGLLCEPSDGGLEVLALNFIQHQFNDASLYENNNIYKHLCNGLIALNGRFQQALLERYPTLRRGFESLLSKRNPGSPLQGATKPPEQSRAEQSRAEPLKEGGVGETRRPAFSADLPSDEEVFDFCREWPGEPASGAPAIPHGYAVEWVAQMAGRTSGWPPDWRRKLKADWRKSHRTWGAGFLAKKSGAWELQQKKAALEQQIKTHPANPDSSAYLGEPSEAAQAELAALVSKRRDVEKELGA